MVSYKQELRCREEELTKAALQQKIQEELLKKREQELASREIDLLERELNILIIQQVMQKPTPKKRKKSKIRMKLLKSGGKSISEPSGLYFLYICFAQYYFHKKCALLSISYWFQGYNIWLLSFGHLFLGAFIDFRHNITVQKEDIPSYDYDKRMYNPSSPDSPPASPVHPYAPPRLRAIACKLHGFCIIMWIL